MELTWSRYDGADCLKVSGWPAGHWERLRATPHESLARSLPVYPAEVLSAATVSLQPVSGRYEVDDDGVCFVPRFPFLAGTAYAVVTEDGETATLTRPVPDVEPVAHVVALYPTAPEIPFNQLKLYVHFSEPMSEGYALRHIHVLSADGNELQGVFHPMDPELWDPNRQRLTVLFDPARIKRGLVPHSTAGYPLRAGEPVSVVVDREYRDARGVPMVAGYQRRYAVGDAVRAKVDPSQWTIVRPPAGTRDPVSVQFDRPLDHALLRHCVTVTDGAGTPVGGSYEVGPEERSWQFTPGDPWPVGDYRVVVDPILEDLAGNSIARVFDRDLTRAEDAPGSAARIALDFAIR